MRALLVVNHTATTTSPRVRDVLVQALRSVVDLTVAHTRSRGHAASLGRQARAEGLDIVVTLGGDGTVNEVVNGLLADGPGPEVPALAVVPGGSTNVFARALGLPRDWVEATGALLEALREGRSRRIGLGRASGRYFTFCAGVGLDAEVIRRVEQARLRGRAASPSLYLRALATRYLTTPRRTGRLVLECPAAGTAPAGPTAAAAAAPASPAAGALAGASLAMLIVQNTSPWTYLGGRPVDACPDASFDLGLDALGMRALPAPAALGAAVRLLSSGAGPRGHQVVRLHDVGEFTVRCPAPVAFQLDGDYLGERSEVRFVAVPEALRVVC